jgi:sulfotransferase
MEQKIFFQSSLPRSGSTLLQNIMGQNPDFYVTPTSGMFELLYAARQNYTDSPEFKAQDPTLMKKAWMGFCNGAMNGYFSAITDKPYVVDKSRAHGVHYDFINFFYENPKIVVMVRDLRDIFASMEKNFRENQHLSSPLVNHAELRGTSTPKRIDIFANSQPVGMAIERLNEMMRQGIDAKVFFVKYEDLCLHPENEMRRIYDFYGVDYYEHDFDNIEQITTEDDSVYGIFGDHKIRTKLEPTRSVARDLLGRDVTNWIWDTYKWYFDYFRYSK